MKFTWQYYSLLSAIFVTDSFILKDWQSQLFIILAVIAMILSVIFGILEVNKND